MRKPTFIKDDEPYKALLWLATNHGFVTALTGGLYLLKQSGELATASNPTQAARQKARRVLKRLEAMLLLKRERYESVDCFAITGRGCRWLEQKYGQDAGTYSPTTEAVRLNKTQTKTIKHRLMSNFWQSYVYLHLADYRSWSDRACSVHATWCLKNLGKVPDGFFCRGKHVVCIEVERSRRKSGGSVQLLKAMRAWTFRGYSDELTVPLWFFVVTKETKADTVRYLKNEFLGKHWQHCRAHNLDCIKFSTGDIGPSASSSLTGWGDALGIALLVEMDFSEVMTWPDQILSVHRPVIPLLNAALDGHVAASELFNRVYLEATEHAKTNFDFQIFD